jgi:alkylation response protein AidB-like acyl-CoA dehydrogenase
MNTLFELTDEQLLLQKTVTDICGHFPGEYWRDLDTRREYPAEFVQTLMDAGLLSVLIPMEYGGGGGTIQDAAVILEAINRSGGTGIPAHAQMYTMKAILRHGSEEQKAKWLPQIAAGEVRLQSMGVTEPDAGSDTTRISTSAVRDGDVYRVNGRKMWTSRVEQSDLMLLLVRTTPYNEVEKKHEGLSVLLVDLRESRDRIEVQPIRTMVNHETFAVFYDNLEVPVENLIGEEGNGFRYILSGLNAERILVASEVLGDGYWLIDKAAEYASQRMVFGRPIGANQGIQLPIAQAFAQLEAASLMRWKAAALFEAGGQPGFEANACKLLASQATWDAANAAMTTFGGYGMATEYDVERKFREARLQLVAPVSNNLVLAYIANKTLGMPKSY